MTDKPFAKIGARIKAIRSTTGMNQARFCERHAFNPQLYNHWESGYRRITVQNAETLCDAYGVTLDFIYRGRRDGLSEAASKSL